MVVSEEVVCFGDGGGVLAKVGKWVCSLFVCWALWCLIGGAGLAAPCSHAFLTLYYYCIMYSFLILLMLCWCIDALEELVIHMYGHTGYAGCAV